MQIDERIRWLYSDNRHVAANSFVTIDQKKSYEKAVRKSAYADTGYFRRTTRKIGLLVLIDSDNPTQMRTHADIAVILEVANRTCGLPASRLPSYYRPFNSTVVRPPNTLLLRSGQGCDNCEQYVIVFLFLARVSQKRPNFTQHIICRIGLCYLLLCGRGSALLWWQYNMLRTRAQIMWTEH